MSSFQTRQGDQGAGTARLPLRHLSATRLLAPVTNSMPVCRCRVGCSNSQDLTIFVTPHQLTKSTAQRSKHARHLTSTTRHLFVISSLWVSTILTSAEAILEISQKMSQPAPVGFVNEPTTLNLRREQAPGREMPPAHLYMRESRRSVDARQPTDAKHLTGQAVPRARTFKSPIERRNTPDGPMKIFGC